MTLPTLTDDQRRHALAKAAEARTARAEFKRALAKFEITPSEAFEKALADGDGTLGKMQVKTFFESLPTMGKVSAQKRMEEFGIAATRRIKGLGDRQKDLIRELCAALDEKVTARQTA